MKLTELNSNVFFHLKKYESDNHVKVTRNSMIRTDLSDLTMNWDRYRSINHSFSNIVKGEMPVTNQKSSGRCWGFAGLNLFRFYIGRKYNLKNFVDNDSYFVVEKSLCGVAIKAMERPGLWNGGMADWNSIFVEVPVRTFNPVKTVNDLLRPMHQSI